MGGKQVMGALLRIDCPIARLIAAMRRLAGFAKLPRSLVARLLRRRHGFEPAFAACEPQLVVLARERDLLAGDHLPPAAVERDAGSDPEDALLLVDCEREARDDPPAEHRAVGQPPPGDHVALLGLVIGNGQQLAAEIAVARRRAARAAMAGDPGAFLVAAHSRLLFPIAVTASDARR